MKKNKRFKKIELKHAHTHTHTHTLCQLEQTGDCCKGLNGSKAWESSTFCLHTHQFYIGILVLSKAKYMSNPH